MGIKHTHTSLTDEQYEAIMRGDGGMSDQFPEDEPGDAMDAQPFDAMAEEGAVNRAMVATPNVEVIAEQIFRGFPEDMDADEQRYTRTVLRLNKPMTEEQLRAWVDDRFPESRCQHMHDCCGHWYESRARIERMGDAVVLVTQSSYQNI